MGSRLIFKQHGYMLIPYLIFAANQIGIFDFLNSSFVSSYLNDLVALPIILHLALIPMKYIVYRDKSYALGSTNILITFIAVSLVFEWFLPTQNPRYVADYFDIACYAAGCIWFYFAIDRRQVKPSTNKTLRRLEVYDKKDQ